MNVLFDEVENEIKDKEQFVVSQNERIKTMYEVLNEMIEYKVVLEKSNKVIHGKFRGHSESLHSIHSSIVGVGGANNDNEIVAPNAFGGAPGGFGTGSPFKNVKLNDRYHLKMIHNLTI
jgi:hypothetical protein